MFSGCLHQTVRYRVLSWHVLFCCCRSICRTPYLYLNYCYRSISSSQPGHYCLTSAISKTFSPRETSVPEAEMQKKKKKKNVFSCFCHHSLQILRTAGGEGRMKGRNREKRSRKWAAENKNIIQQKKEKKEWRRFIVLPFTCLSISTLTSLCVCGVTIAAVSLLLSWQQEFRADSFPSPPSLSLSDWAQFKTSCAEHTVELPHCGAWLTVLLTSCCPAYVSLRQNEISYQSESTSSIFPLVIFPTFLKHILYFF